MTEGNYEERIVALEKIVLSLMESHTRVLQLLKLNSDTEPDRIKFLILLRDDFNSLLKFVCSMFGDEPTRKQNLLKLEKRKAEWDNAVAPFFAATAVPPLPPLPPFQADGPMAGV